MKNHLKRIACPKSWALDRKQNTFTLRPAPGAHSFDRGLTLGFILRDKLKLANTAREVRKLLHENEVLVDGKRRRDIHLIVGLFDVLSIPSLNKNFRVSFNQKGFLDLFEVTTEEAAHKLCKIVGKTAISKGKIQFNCHDGRNLIADIKAKVGDSLLVDFKNKKIKEVFPLQIGSPIYLIGGKRTGNLGILKTIKGKDALYEAEGNTVETATTYLFVTGKEKSII